MKIPKRHPGELMLDLALTMSAIGAVVYVTLKNFKDIIL